MSTASSHVAAKRAATKRRATLATMVKLPSDQRQHALRQMSETLHMQATKSEYAAKADEKQAAAALEQLEAAQADLKKDMAVNEKLERLLAQLQERHHY